MKDFVPFLLLICSLHALAQQSDIRGRVSIFNSETRTGRRQYVSNAQVEAEFGKATPTATNNNGQFKLVYVEVKGNASVSFQVKKAGLLVVNKDALSAIAGQADQ
jgi:tRNA(Phe) wybutosine-synthesizing methylase Tyw3